MRGTRFWRLGGIAAAMLILVGAWFGLVNPQREEAAALDTETASQEAASAQLAAKISLLKKMSEELPAQEAKLAAIQQRMPATVALPTLIRNLTDVAANARVVVASVTPGRPAPVQEVIAMTGPPPAEEGAEEAGAEVDSADVDEAATAPGTDTAGPGVESVSLSITACGTFAQLRNYLGNLEDMKRVVNVSGLSIARGSCAEGSSQDDLTATITASVFTLPSASPEATADASTTGGTAQ